MYITYDRWGKSKFNKYYISSEKPSENKDGTCNFPFPSERVSFKHQIIKDIEHQGIQLPTADDPPVQIGFYVKPEEEKCSKCGDKFRRFYLEEGQLFCATCIAKTIPDVAVLLDKSYIEREKLHCCFYRNMIETIGFDVGEYFRVGNYDEEFIVTNDNINTYYKSVIETIKRWQDDYNSATRKDVYAFKEELKQKITDITAETIRIGGDGTFKLLTFLQQLADEF